LLLRSCKTTIVNCQFHLKNKSKKSTNKVSQKLYLIINLTGVLSHVANSNLESISHKRIFISMVAKRIPRQLLGPAPNGKKVSFSRLALFSGLNLAFFKLKKYIDTKCFEYRVQIPFRYEFLWLRVKHRTTLHNPN